jgi:hypothetical protein
MSDRPRRALNGQTARWLPIPCRANTDARCAAISFHEESSSKAPFDPVAATAEPSSYHCKHDSLALRRALQGVLRTLITALLLSQYRACRTAACVSAANFGYISLMLISGEAPWHQDTTFTNVSVPI